MRISNTLIRASLFSVVFSTLVFSGCATRGYQKAAATSDAMTAAAHQVDVARSQIGDATSVLRALSTQSPAELRPEFEQYRSAVANLEKTAAGLRQQTDEMEKRGRAYFDAWDDRLSQIRNEDIRARSADRQREVTQQFADIRRRYQDARAELEPFMSTLRDVQASLGMDLTPAGIQSVRPYIDQADRNAERARSGLDRLAEGLRNLGATLNPTGKPAPIVTPSASR